MGFGTYITIQKTFGKKLNRTVGENMKALVLTDYYKFEYKDVPEPTCKDDEVVVNVKACAICGSDVHGYDGTSGRRQPPIIMGHEAAGVISAIGKNVTGYQVGDRVTFDSTVYCGKCWHCRRGEVNLCENRMVLGVACDDYRNPGAMAEYVTVPERILYKIPDNVSFVQAAGVEPLSVAMHALSMSKFHLGDHAAVVGAGTIGLLLTQLLKAAGASQITVIDIDEEKLNLAKRFGATTVINSAKEDPASLIRTKGSGRGADIVFEAVGISATIQTAISCVRIGGSIVMVGNLAAKVDLPLQKCVTQQIDLQGTCASAGEYDVCLELIGCGMVDIDSIISKVAPLSEGAKWFDRLHAAEPGLIKVVLEP